jgi:hypothetical protein
MLETQLSLIVQTNDETNEFRVLLEIETERETLSAVIPFDQFKEALDSVLGAVSEGYTAGR